MHPTPKSFGLIHTCIIYIYIYIYIQYLLNAPHPKKLWLDPYLYYIYIYIYIYIQCLLKITCHFAQRATIVFACKYLITQLYCNQYAQARTFNAII